MATVENTDSFVCFKPRPHASVRLICLPWAGAGAAQYHEWVQWLPEDVELQAVRLAGRERRLLQKPSDRIADVVAELVDAWTGSAGHEYVLFGQCLGGILGFEFVREVRRRQLAMPLRLITASTPAPRTYTTPRPLGDLSDELRELGLTNDDIIASARAFALLRGGIEADLKMIRSYVYEAEDLLDVPISVLMASGDHAYAEQFAEWRSETTQATDFRVIEGPHLYPGGSWRELARAVADDVLGQRGVTTGERAEAGTRYRLPGHPPDTA